MVKRFHLTSFFLMLCLIGKAQTACDLSTYGSAYIINTNDYPYTSPSTGITVNASWPGVSTLNNFSYSCNGQAFNTASPAWWLNSSTQTITITFSAPVTAFSVVFNGTNGGEEFYFGAASGTVSLSNYCTNGYTSINGNTGLRYGNFSTSGNHVTVNHAAGETTFTLRHNGVGSGSRIALLDCIVPASPLPIELESFQGFCDDGWNTLRWRTSTEINNHYFNVERSFDGKQYQSVAKIEGAGNSNTINEYHWKDPGKFYKTVYYRLKQTDFNGNHSYSDPLAIEKCKEPSGKVFLYPNPTQDKLFLSGKGAESSLPYFITDIAGRKIRSGIYSGDGISVHPMSKGLYILHLEKETGPQTMEFIKK